PRGERQPPRPHEPVAQRAERPTQRRAQTLDVLGRYAVALRARRRADSEATQVRVRVEEMRPPRHGGAVRHTVVPALGLQVPQQRLLGDADAHALHPLVVPGPLHCEQPEQAADEPRPGADPGGARRSACRLSPPAIPVISPTNAPSPSPIVPAAACAALTAATVAGPYSG